MELTNFTVWGRDWFADGWEGLRAFCDAQGLAGVELFAAGATPHTAPPADLVRGIHLRSLGSWLPLAGIPIADFCEGSRRYQEASTYHALVQARTDELRQAAAFQPEYVVWHGSYAPRELVLEGHSDLTDAQFLERLASLVRDVLAEFTPPCVVCFENALGVGVGPDAAQATAAFLQALAGSPVGLALDIGHHLNRHRDIADAEAACKELQRVAEELGKHAVRVEVLHLHWTPPAALAGGPPACKAPGPYFEHADQHHPLTHSLLAEAVAAVAPKYVVHEMGAMNLAEHEAWLQAQAKALRGEVSQPARSAP